MATTRPRLSEAQRRGYMSHEFLVNCGCGNHEYLACGGRETRREARRIGYRYTTARGWTCPRCQRADAGRAALASAGSEAGK